MTETKKDTMFDKMEMGLDLWVAYLNSCNMYLQNLLTLANSMKDFMKSTRTIHENYGLLAGKSLYG
jgi:hypothetical protein